MSSGAWDLLPGLCCLLAAAGATANVALNLLGGVPVPAEPLRQTLFSVYLSLWGNAPLLFGLSTLVTFSAFNRGLPLGIRRRWLVYSGICLAFWLCPPVFVL